MIERTLVLLKPDAIQRGLVGEILQRFEQRGLKIVGMKMVWLNREFTEQHYAEHVKKPFFQELASFIEEGPLVAIVVEGLKSISAVRKIVGTTRPEEALPGTIRGDYAHYLIRGQNLVHASANQKDAKKEIKLWFKDKEMHSYQRDDEKHTTR